MFFVGVCIYAAISSLARPRFLLPTSIIIIPVCPSAHPSARISARILSCPSAHPSTRPSAYPSPHPLFFSPGFRFPSLARDAYDSTPFPGQQPSLLADTRPTSHAAYAHSAHHACLPHLLPLSFYDRCFPPCNILLTSHTRVQYLVARPESLLPLL